MSTSEIVDLMQVVLSYFSLLFIFSCKREAKQRNLSDVILLEKVIYDFKSNTYYLKIT